MQMARKNDRWLIVVLLAVLAVFGFVCITQRNAATASPKPESFSVAEKAAGPPVVASVADDNIELIEGGPEFGTGPVSTGRIRYTSENLF